MDGINVREGTIGLRVTGNSNLIYTVIADNAVVKQTGKLTFKIVNKGFADARFVSVKIIPNNFVLLSEGEVYIGSVDSDDFETVGFDVIFQGNEANFQVLVEYKDFNNKDIINGISLPLTIYSEEEALGLGIIKPNRSSSFFAGFIILVVGIIIYRAVKKRRRLKKSKQRKNK